MQHEAAAGLDRPALQHFHGLGGFRQLDLVGLLDDVELHQQFGKVDAAGGPVDDDAHRAFGRMRADIDHRAREPLVFHHRHRDQQLAVEIAPAWTIVADAGILRRLPDRLPSGLHRAKTLMSRSHPDIGSRFCQSSFRCIEYDHKQFNGLVPHQPVKTSDEHMFPSMPRSASRPHCLLVVLALAARAQDASPWQQDSHSAVRLLAGSRSGAVLLGGIAFQLQPGWKTYWRTPGDSGVPPRFDFSKSDNVEAVTILWPAPTKFDDGAGGHSLGYQTRSCCRCASSPRTPTSR